MVRLLLAASAMLVGSAVALLLVADQQEGEQPGWPAATTAVAPRTASSIVVDDAIPRRSVLSQLVDGQPRNAAPRPWKARGLPETLQIRSLDVHATVLPVEADGRVLLPPDDPTRVGWWKDGALPGAAYGSAVITGHTVSTGGGAFDDLDRLHAGDHLTLWTSNGVLSYVVDDVAAYPKQSLARHARRVFSQSVPGRLVLVTCEDWNGEVYLSNQVVFAHPV